MLFRTPGPRLYRGFESSGFPEGISPHCTTIVQALSEDLEIWNGSGGDSHGRVLEADMPHQTAGMQTVQRVKRQNCGNNVPGHHNLIIGNRDQIGSRFAVPNVEAEGIMSHSPRTMLAGFHGSADQGDRKLNEGNFQSGHTEIAGSSSGFAGLPSYAGNVLRSPAGERHSPHYRASGLMGNFINSSYPPQSYTGSRNSCKRKSSMNEVIVSVGSLSFRPFIEQRESEFSRFTEAAGTSSRADFAFPSPSFNRNLTSGFPSSDSLPNFRYSHMMYQQPSRPMPSYHAQIESNRFYGGHGPQEQSHAPYAAQTNRVASGFLPSNMLMSRGMISQEHSMQSTWSSHEFSAVNQSHGSSAVVPWCGNGSGSGERTTHSDSSREYSTGPYIGSHARNMSNGASIWMGVPPWTQNMFEPFSTGFPCREFFPQGSPRAPVRHMHSSPMALSCPPSFTGHTSPYPQGCLLPYPPPSHTSVILGSQAATGHAYLPSLELLHRSAMRSPFLGSTESSGASPLRNFHGMPFQAEIRGGPLRNPRHGLFDHAFTYTGFNVYDHHLGLQPDVDNMSYEELLALGERIGNVNTGLSVENVCKCLQTSKHSSYDVTRSAVSQESEIKCSICQEEYIEGDDIGELECSHGYHTACIKQWLMLKNQCPICKASALSLP